MSQWFLQTFKKSSYKSDLWLTVHRNSVWIRKTIYMSRFVFFIFLLIVAQHVSDNHVPIIRSWRLRDVLYSCWYVPRLQGGGQVRLAGSASMDGFVSQLVIRTHPWTHYLPTGLDNLHFFCILYFSSNSCSKCFGQPCAHHQELTTAWCYSLVLVCAVAAGRWSSPVGR